MNFPQNIVNNSVATQQPPILGHQQPFSPQSQWENNGYNAYQLPLQLSQYYNVFPEVGLPSTKTSWTFPNGCVTSNIVRFTGTPTPTYPNGPNLQTQEQKMPIGAIPVKRKSLTKDEIPQPNKMFITEEKMAARMSGMHISNEFVSHSTNQFSSFQNESESGEELPEYTLQSGSEPQLVVCDELKDLQKDLSPYIPNPLLPLEKPTTALVLWRPPAAYLNVVKVPPEEEYPSRSSVIITDITDRPDLDNNNISTVDLNSLINSPIQSSQDSMEVMEM